MKKERHDDRNLSFPDSVNGDNYLPGYPVYPEDEDIFSVYREEKDLDPEEIPEAEDLLAEYIIAGKTEKNVNDGFAGDDLDIPGSELDDKMEYLGSEDEENNYYSLGGDDHDDLEEEQDWVD
jgi:hypothetical protein